MTGFAVALAHFDSVALTADMHMLLVWCGTCPKVVPRVHEVARLPVALKVEQVGVEDRVPQRQPGVVASIQLPRTATRCVCSGAPLAATMESESPDAASAEVVV